MEEYCNGTPRVSRSEISALVHLSLLLQPSRVDEHVIPYNYHHSGTNANIHYIQVRYYNISTTKDGAYHFVARVGFHYP